MLPAFSPVGRAAREHAIVLGASLAGLLAARVLADRYRQVTIVERDGLPDGVAQRRGVPQGQHTHGLLAAGSRALDRLFPGFTDEMVRCGGLPGDIVRDVRWVFEGAPLARPDSGMDGLMASRPLLEAGVRARTLALPNVVARSGCQATALVATPHRDRVVGVTLNTGETLAADLVVDATGRGSRAPEWLEALGYERPREDKVEVGLGYTTRHFRRHPSHLDGDHGVVIPPTPDGKRGGVMIAQEDDRWTVTLMAHFVAPAASDLEGFAWFASRLPSPDILAVVSRAEPIGGATTARFPASVRRRYERMPHVPDDFVVTGDAICSFNPIYGQGMSVAALEAEALGATLDQGDARIGPRFFAKAARIVDTPWMTAAGNDLRMPEAVGPRSAVNTIVNAYMARLHRTAQTDADLTVRFMRVTNLLAPPTTLFAPATVWRVLRGPRAELRPAASPLPRPVSNG